MSPSVDADIPAGTTILGVPVEDVQDGITVSENAITGTLHYITGLTGYSDDPAEQSGNYLVLHVDPATTPVTYNGASFEPDENGYVVIRITDTTEPITIGEEELEIETELGG